jgi:NADPH:quinone reductase-like Zn-dependent oxidoreductase/Kef-type K+ transport system membrane component KefB
VGEMSFEDLFLVCLVAALVPLLLGSLPRLRVPSVVLEIGAGVLLGPAVLGLIEVDAPVAVLAWLGLAFLLFLAGLEIDVAGLAGPRLWTAVQGYALTIALAFPGAVLLAALGWISSPALLVVALSATSLGLVVPILKDAQQISTPAGQTLVVACTVADLASIAALSVFFGTQGGAAVRSVLLALFAAAVLLVTLSVMGVRRSGRIQAALGRLQQTTAHVRVRLALVLLVGLTALAGRFGLETILGAFLAGVVLGALDRRPRGREQFRGELGAVGFGFLVPVFYVATGLSLDVRGLFSGEGALLQVPVFLLLLLVVRGVPALLYLRASGARTTVAAGLLQATSLPFIVTATQVGLSNGAISAVSAAALVTAGVLSVALFPTAAFALLRPAPPTPSAGEPPNPPRPCPRAKRATTAAEPARSRSVRTPEHKEHRHEQPPGPRACIARRTAAPGGHAVGRGRTTVGRAGTMKAVRYHQYGDESALRHEDAERPFAGPGQVVIRVAATSFNPVDVALRAGYLQEVYPLSFPHVPGFDVAGTVAEVGVGTTGLSVGDTVLGFLPMDQDGAAAEYVVAPAGVLTAAPATIPLTDAAALPSAGLTAWQALHEHLALQAGQRLLVNGAGGAVCGYAVQLAKEAGAPVIAVVGRDSADRVQRYGADQLIDRTRTPVADALNGTVDAVLNLAPVGPEDMAALVQGVRPGGVCVTTVPSGPMGTVGDVDVVSMFVRSDVSQLAGLVSRVDDGRLRVWVDDTLLLGELASVHARSAGGRLHGKVVLVP